MGVIKVDRQKKNKEAIDTIEGKIKKLEQEKKEYEDMTLVSSAGDVELANQLERYSIESLWVKLGNHATSEGVVLKMDVVAGSSKAENNYDLKFTVTGSYISITDFISDIENDSTLGFRIEEFEMTPSGSDLQATFVCRDVAITEVLEEQPNITQTNNTNTNTTNTTNTTNQNNTTNTTNATQNTTNVTQ